MNKISSNLKICIFTDVDANTATEQPQPKKAKRTEIKLPRILDGQFYVYEGIIENIPPDGNITVRCKTCNSDKKGSIKSTGNFLNHYRVAHASLMSEVEQHIKRTERSDATNLSQTTIQFGPVVSKLDVS